MRVVVQLHLYLSVYSGRDVVICCFVVFDPGDDGTQRVIVSSTNSTKGLSMNNPNAPTNATQAKDRLYAQLAGSLGRMSRAVGHTADLYEQLQVDLHAMRTFAALDAAK